MFFSPYICNQIFSHMCSFFRSPGLVSSCYFNYFFTYAVLPVAITSSCKFTEFHHVCLKKLTSNWNLIACKLITTEDTLALEIRILVSQNILETAILLLSHYNHFEDCCSSPRELVSHCLTQTWATTIT